MRRQNVKLCFFPILLLMVQVAFCQSEEFIEYSAELALQDFERATELEKSDSINEAIWLYKYVAELDSLSVIGKKSMDKLDSVWMIEKGIFQNQLLGEWRWIWSGTNWGTSNSPKKCNCEKFMKFEANEIVIIEDNVEKERLSYRIIRDISKIGTNSFEIDIGNGLQRWSLRVYEEVENAYYLAERTENSSWFMSFRDEDVIPNCVCGCPEKRFEKR